MSRGRPWGRSAAGRRPGVLLAACLAVGCADREAEPPGPPADAASATLSLFRLAEEPDPPQESLRLVLEVERLESDRVAALEALGALREASAPRVLGETWLPAVQRTAVDVEAALPGGGSARYSVQVEELPDAGWRVVSIQGPGVDWPPRPDRKDPALTTSAPPGADDD